MPLTGAARNIGIEAITAVLTWVGLYTASSATTGWKSTNAKELEKTSHGYVDDDLIYVKEASEGGTGSMVKKGQFLFVKKVSANVIQVSQTNSVYGFKAEEWTAEVKGTVELEKMTEVSGAPYKRLKAKWTAITPGTSPNGVQEDTEKHEIPCAEGTVVDAVSYHTAETSGSLRGIEKVTKETVGGSKVYVDNSTKLDFLTL